MLQVTTLSLGECCSFKSEVWHANSSSLSMPVEPRCLTQVCLLHVQLEVIFAALWSIASWRGVYAGLRPYI